MEYQTHAKIVDLLGGPKALALRLTAETGGYQVRRNAVQVWKHRNCIPFRWRLLVVKLAKADGFSDAIPPGFMSPTPKRRSQG